MVSLVYDQLVPSLSSVLLQWRENLLLSDFPLKKSLNSYSELGKREKGRVKTAAFILLEVLCCVYGKYV